MNEIIKILVGVLDSSDFWDLFKGNKQKQREFIERLTEQMRQSDMLQVELNKVEANHKSIFVAGWRPFIGWVCGSALAYNFILQPLLEFVLSASGVTVSPPELEIGQLITIVLGMLGMAGYRTYEKYKSVDTKNMKS
ncbi:3TM-type holin [Sediminibacter sp. Hel_I_10]|uniref:3TM-type holin n=1 Tax=Sediminibacter sp. Hel_I_10 TaxID=1392490 RepID=UPI00068A581A|nr:3TM-type holin [Sediminibacter sp. Hel_I_10]